MVRILKPTDEKYGLVKLSGTYYPDTKKTVAIWTISSGAFSTVRTLQSPKPSQGGKSRCGNRSCFHPQLEGDAYLWPYDRLGLEEDDLCWPFRTRNSFAQIEQFEVDGYTITHVQWDNPKLGTLYRWKGEPGKPGSKPAYKSVQWRESFHIEPTDPILIGSWYKSGKRVTKYVDAPTDVGDIMYRGAVQSTCMTLSTRVPPFNRQETFGALNDDIASQAVYVDCNTPMLIRELIRLKEDTTALAGILRGKIDSRALADLYLSTKYGARLTIHDANVIMDKVTDHLTGMIPEQEIYRAHSRSSLTFDGSGIFGDWLVECVSTVWYRPRPQWTLDRSLSNLIKWDLGPSLQNVWDFIPYTFVVDWFLDVEGALKSLDNQALWALNEVLECTETVKYTTSVDASIIDRRLAGSLTFTVYDRTVKPTLTYRQFHFTPSLDGFKHVAELSALIRQRV